MVRSGGAARGGQVADALPGHLGLRALHAAAMFADVAASHFHELHSHAVCAASATHPARAAATPFKESATTFSRPSVS